MLHFTPLSLRRLLMSLTCLVTLGASLFLASSVANASTSSPILVVGPASFNGNIDCTYGAGQGWNCTATLSRGDTLQKNLTWSAYSSGITGITFNPASGVLGSGATTSVSIAVPDNVCPHKAAFTFKGPGNTVRVPWTCGSPTMTLDQPTLKAGQNCPAVSGGWTCTANVGETAGSQGNLNWFTSSSLAGVTFSPASGTLSPGSSTAVGLFIPTTACKNGAFTFTSPKNQTIHVPWSCKSPAPGPVLTINPSTFNQGSSNCSFDENTYQCTVTLGETTSSTENINWTATSTFSDSTIVPSQGTLSPGGSTTVTLQSLPCQNGTFTFSGQTRVQPITASFNCTPPPPPPALTISPNSMDPSNTACTGGTTSPQCTVTLDETSASQGNANWSASSDLSGVSFNPSSGTLAPGGSVSIVISSIACQNGTFTFSGAEGESPVSIAWSCTPPPLPILTVNIANLTPGNASCGFSGISNQCTITLGETTSSTTNVDFSASSSFSGVTFSPASGTLSPGGSTQMVITMAASACQNGTFTFSGSGGASPVAVSWFCSPTVLQVQPAQIDPSTCTSTPFSGVYTCTIHLSNPLVSQGPLFWTPVSSMSNLSFNPGPGSLYPGQSTIITVSNLPCQQGGTITILVRDSQGTQLNPVTITWPPNTSCI